MRPAGRQRRSRARAGLSSRRAGLDPIVVESPWIKVDRTGTRTGSAASSEREI